MIHVQIQHQQGDFCLNLQASCPGEGVTAILGPSGCGKSTLAHVMAGLKVPQVGRIQLNETTFLDTQCGLSMPIERRGIGYLFQSHRLFPHMTVAENLDFGVTLGRRQASLGRDELIDILGIGPLLNRYPSSLSGGESQRVALGRALRASERLLILDEPLSSLDEERKEEVLAYLERLLDHIPIPVWLITHSTHEAKRLASHCWRLRAGQLIEEGPFV